MKMAAPTARRLVQAGAVATVLLAGATASALDKFEIMNMQTMGLNPATIVQVIRNSPDLTVSPDEVEELRAAGAAPEVIGALCERVACAGSGPAPGGPGPGMPGGPGLEQEMERQRQLEAERIRLEEQRLQQEREQMRQRLEAEAARAQAQGQPAFAGLTTARNAYRAGRLVEAAAAYDGFLAEQSDRQGAEYYEALAGFVRSMHARGYRHIVRQRALEAVLLGPTRPHFAEMFTILSSISSEVGYMDPQFETFTGFSISQYDAEFQDRFNFFLGRFFWVYGESNRALEFLSRVSAEADERGRAHYLAGTILLSLDQNSRAANEFQQAVVRTQTNGTDPEVAELANLALARITYEINQFDAALYYYNQVPRTSFRYGRALFESTWAYFLKGDWDRTLGSIHSLHSPYQNYRFHPDAMVLEAATYLNICQLESAEEAISAFFDRTRRLQQATNAFIATATSPDVYWDAVETWYERAGTSDPVDLPIEAIRAVIGDVDYINQRRLLSQLEREATLLEADGPRLGTFGQTATGAIATDLRTKSIEAGLKVSQMIRDFAAEMSEWDTKAQEIGIEVSTARLAMIDQELSGQAAAAAGTTTFVLAGDWLFWPWEGEYWKDEIGNYRGNSENLRDPNTGACTSPRSAGQDL